MIYYRKIQPMGKFSRGIGIPIYILEKLKWKKGETLCIEHPKGTKFLVIKKEE